MHPELENLIKIAMTDGILSDKERATIIRKAESLGLDKDEVEMILDAKVYEEKQKQAQNKRETISKCPNCGEASHVLSQVCSTCGYIYTTATHDIGSSKSLNACVEELERLIVDVKSLPKPEFGDRMRTVLLTYSTLGLYLPFRKLFRKFFHKNEDTFDSLLARCEKESRSIKARFGEDRKIQMLMEELTAEILGAKNERLRLNKRLNLGCLGTIVAVIVFYAVLGVFVFKSEEIEEQKYAVTAKIVDSLLLNGEVNKALQEAYKITEEHIKNKMLERIYVRQIEQYIFSNQLDSARQIATLIDSKYRKEEIWDRITQIEIDKLIQEQKLMEAQNKAAQLYNVYERNQMLERLKELNK